MSEGKDVIVFEHQGLRLTKADHEVILKSFVSPDATPEEVRVFYYDCARRGVHPMDRLIHFSKRGGRYVPITGIDFMLQRAEASGQYAGCDDAVFDEGDGKYPISATVTVWKRFDKDERYAFTATARWSEYAPQPIEDKSGFMWRKMGHTMLAKCALAQALRKAFPGLLAGLYERSELDQADVQPSSRDVTPEVIDAIAVNPEPAPTQVVSDPAPRNWPGEVVDRIKAAWEAANVIPPDAAPKHVVMLLNLSPFGPALTDAQAVEWGRMYRGLRDEGMKTHEAAALAREQYVAGAPIPVN